MYKYSSRARAANNAGGLVRRKAARTGAGQTARGHVDREHLAEVALGRTRQYCLDGILEGEVERLGREVPHAVHEVAAPEGGDALLSRHAGEAVADAGVTFYLPTFQQSNRHTFG